MVNDIRHLVLADEAKKMSQSHEQRHKMNLSNINIPYFENDIISVLSATLWNNLNRQTVNNLVELASYDVT